MLRTILCGFIAAAAGPMAHGQSGEGSQSGDLFSLVLVVADLQDAQKTMTIHDLNDDQFIDREEQRALSWKDDVEKFDLNADGKLTHLEVSVRFADQRAESDVTQFDRKNANLWMKRKDINRNGQLDADEIARGWPDQPEEFDTNKDGIISLTEMAAQFAFKRGLRREMGIEMVDQTAAIKIVNQYDTDSDKKLTADEWAAAELPRDGTLHDDDGDGALTIMEVATLLAKHRRSTGMSKSDLMKARQMITRADMDRDGKLNRQEQGIFADDNVGQYDADKDGIVTLAEIEQSFAKARKDKGYLDDDLFNARRLMTRHDVNRNMMIDSDELFDRPAKGQLSVDLLNKADADRDASISLDELAKHLAREDRDD